MSRPEPMSSVREVQAPAAPRGRALAVPAFAPPLTGVATVQSTWDAESALAQDRAVERRLPWKELMILALILVLVLARLALVH